MSSGGYDDNGDWHWNDGDSTNPAAELRAAAKAIFRASPWHEEYARRNARKTDLLGKEGQDG